MNKKGQESGVGMSFGFIFSIILIIVFVFAAIWGIKYFLDLNNCSRIGFGLSDLQKEVTKAHQSSVYSRQIELDLPGIEKICFANLSADITGDQTIYDSIEIYQYQDANTFLYPEKNACDIPYKKINFLNLSAITKDSNPYCVDPKEKITITLDPETTGRGVLIK